MRGITKLYKFLSRYGDTNKALHIILTRLIYQNTILQIFIIITKGCILSYKSPRIYFNLKTKKLKITRYFFMSKKQEEVLGSMGCVHRGFT